MKIRPGTAELRAVSRVAFGQAHRLELMLAVMASEDGLCTLTELARRLNVTMSSLQRPFQALVDLGLLTELPDTGTRFRYYARNPSSAWQWAADLSATVGAAVVDAADRSA
ncbi:helix-turn-helix domain-containing protein [Microbacterium esteraromaticum]|uniref:helix-turn-helix domain-containing protein n=1 Tax=Microbacterium esteraromaticum TaxID=57043 RepID=UPI003381A456